jgi:hypothetical protein
LNAKLEPTETIELIESKVTFFYGKLDDSEQLIFQKSHKKVNLPNLTLIEKLISYSFIREKSIKLIMGSLKRRIQE